MRYKVVDLHIQVYGDMISLEAIDCKSFTGDNEREGNKMNDYLIRLDALKRQQIKQIFSLLKGQLYSGKGFVFEETMFFPFLESVLKVYDWSDRGIISLARHITFGDLRSLFTDVPFPKSGFEEIAALKARYAKMEEQNQAENPDHVSEEAEAEARDDRPHDKEGDKLSEKQD